MKILLDYDAVPRIALRVLLMAVVATAVSLVASPLAGGLVFALGLTLLVTYEAARSRGVLSEAERAPHAHGGAGHVLVVADAPIVGDGVAEVIVGLAGRQAQLDVLAPVLASRTHHLTSDIDAERRNAQRRLQSALAWAADRGLEARGEVGDDDPATGIADELRDFGPEAVVIVTSGDRKTRWAEQRELESARSELGIPLMQVTPTGGRQ